MKRTLPTPSAGVARLLTTTWGLIAVALPFPVFVAFHSAGLLPSNLYRPFITAATVIVCLGVLGVAFSATGPGRAITSLVEQVGDWRYRRQQGAAAAFREPAPRRFDASNPFRPATQPGTGPERFVGCNQPGDHSGHPNCDVRVVLPAEEGT